MNKILIFLPNSSKTSFAHVELTFVEIFALGAAKGFFIIFKIFWATLCLGNLIATVFFPAVAILLILDFGFFFNMKVIGPGQKALYSFSKELL